MSGPSCKSRHVIMRFVRLLPQCFKGLITLTVMRVSLTEVRTFHLIYAHILNVRCLQKRSDTKVNLMKTKPQSRIAFEFYVKRTKRREHNLHIFSLFWLRVLLEKCNAHYFTHSEQNVAIITIGIVKKLRAIIQINKVPVFI
jgi:hypothetical protein